jgi:hypothetical protein
VAPKPHQDGRKTRKERTNYLEGTKMGATGIEGWAGKANYYIDTQFQQANQVI